MLFHTLYPLRTKSPRVIWTGVVTVLLAAPLNAVATSQDRAGPDQTATEVATGQLAGTTLTITPRIGHYQTAVLRVSGPDHYALTKRFETNAPIRAELRAEGRQSTDGDGNGKTSNALPRGNYNYEVVFHTGSAKAKAHTGTFQYP